MEASVVQRQLPYGQSERNPKNVLYRIEDPSLRFWYRVYSPHKSRWRLYSKREKEALLRLHASSIFEDYARSLWPGARPYWEKDKEFDIVRQEVRRSKSKRLVVSEVKFKKLSIKDRHLVRETLEARWALTKLAHRLPTPTFEVVDFSVLRHPPR